MENVPTEEEFEAMLKGVNFYYGYIDNNRRYLQEEKSSKRLKLSLKSMNL